jgi:hypothetical protein
MAAVEGRVEQGRDHNHQSGDYGYGYHTDASEHANSMQMARLGRLRSALEN